MDQSITVKVSGKAKTLKMTFGLLDLVARAVGDVDGIPEMAVNSDMRKVVLAEILSDRDDEGVVTRAYNAFQDELSPSDAVKIFGWVSEHILDFFLQALTGSKNLMKNRAQELQNLMLSSAGSQT